MTKRQEEQLQRLLDQKAREEAEDKAFFSQVRKRRGDTLRMLEIDDMAYKTMVAKAAEANVSIEQMASVIQRIPPEWIHKILQQKAQEQG